jgi:hypothetical protein
MDNRNKLKEARENREAALKEKEAIEFAIWLNHNCNPILTSQGQKWSLHGKQGGFMDSAEAYVEFKKSQR